MKSINETVGKVLSDLSKTILPTISRPLEKSSGDVERQRLRNEKLDRFPKLSTQWQQWTFPDVRVTHHEVQDAANAIQQFAKHYMQNVRPERLILCGPTGTGKTSMLEGLYAWARRVGSSIDEAWLGTFPQAKFCRWQAIVANIHEPGTNFANIVGDLLERNALLCIDDIGAESDRFKSGLSLDALSHLLNIVHERTWLAITTNYGPDEWREKFGARIEDRLLRESTVCHLEHVPSWSKL